VRETNRGLLGSDTA